MPRAFVARRNARTADWLRGMLLNSWGSFGPALLAGYFGRWRWLGLAPFRTWRNRNALTELGHVAIVSFLVGKR